MPLACPTCRRKLDVETVLKDAVAVPAGGKRRGYKCPRCRSHVIVMLAPKTVIVGSIDGGPGPCFIESGRAPRRGVARKAR